jgi:hypothetical protein
MAATDGPPFGFRLVSGDGGTLGTIDSVDPNFQPGDLIVLDGVGYWVRSVIPMERIAEFIDAPAHGLLEVEPL